MQTIPTELYEAARIDGAGPVQIFFRITVPMLRPIILFTVIVSTVAIAWLVFLVIMLFVAVNWRIVQRREK